MQFLSLLPVGAVAIAFALGVWLFRKFRGGHRQFSLRQLQLAMLLLSIPLAWYAWGIQEYLHEQRVIGVLTQAGVAVQTSVAPRQLQALLVGSWAQERAVAAHFDANPAQPRDLEYLRDLRYLSLIRVREGTFSDDDLVHLSRLRRLRTLTLRNCPITGFGLKYLTAGAPLTSLELPFCPIDDAGLVPIARWRSLNNLSLEGTDITDAGLGHLAALKQLRNLNLNYTAVTDAGIESHQFVSRLQQVTLLNTEVSKAVGQRITRRSGMWMVAPSTADRIAASRLSALGAGIHFTGSAWNPCCVTIGHGWKHSPDAAEWLRQLSGVGQVCFRTGATDSDIALLKELKNLRVIMIEDAAITDRGLEELSRQHHPLLSNIQIRSPHITPGGVGHLATFPSLDHLWLSNISVSAAEVQPFEALQQLGSLSFWKNPAVTDETAFKLQLLLPHTRVSHDTENAHLTGDRGDADLIALRTPQTEQKAMHVLRDQGMCFESPNRAGQFRRAWGTTADMNLTIEQLCAIPALESLILNCSKQTSISLQSLSRLSHLRELSLFIHDFRGVNLEPIHALPHLRQLSLHGENIDDALVQLQDLPNLLMLEIESKDPSTRWLKRLPKFNSLETLRIFSGRYSEFDLGPVTELPHLRNLSLSIYRLTDEDLKSLSKLGPLTTLSLQLAEITDASIPFLAKQTSLKTLDISHTKITDQGVDRLREALPMVEIRATESQGSRR